MGRPTDSGPRGHHDTNLRAQIHEATSAPAPGHPHPAPAGPAKPGPVKPGPAKSDNAASATQEPATREVASRELATAAPAVSGIQVLDRAVLILTALAEQPCTLAELCARTGLPRATAHRMATALEKHRLVQRQANGAFSPGPALAELIPGSRHPLQVLAGQYLPQLMRQLGESVQIYRISGHERVCIANSEPATGLRDTVPVGHRMSLHAGSAAKVLAAWAPKSFQEQVLASAAYTAEELATVRATGVAESRAERDPSLASASVPIVDAHGTVIAALSVSGPVDRMGEHPAQLFGDALRATAEQLQHALADPDAHRG